MTDRDTAIEAALARVRDDLVEGSKCRIARRRARRLGTTLLVLIVVALGGGTVAVADGVLGADGPSETLLTGDLAHLAAVSQRAATTIGKPTPGKAIHAFTKAADGFDLDVVPTETGQLCFLLFHASAQLGTDHGSTCADPANVGKRPVLSATAPDGSGEVFGIAPAGATSGTFTLYGRELPLILHDGFWAVKIPAAPVAPTGILGAAGAISAATVSFH